MSKVSRNVHINVSSNVAGQMGKGTVAATGLSGALKGVGTSATLATGGIRAMTAALISSGIGALVVAAGALIAGFMGLVNSSREFSKSMSSLKAVLGDKASDIALGELADDAKRLGATTAFTASQVVKLQTEFSKLGFSTDEILAATEATLDLAAASETDLASAAAVAGNTIRSFGLTANDTQMVVDVMAKSFTSSALDMNKFQESMKLVAPIAATVKVGVQEASAALAILADRGVSGSMAGTQLRRIMSDLATKTGKDFATSLEITQKRLAEAGTEAEKLAIAKELVGDRAKGSLIALAENREELAGLKVAFDDAGGAAEQMANDQLDNLDGDLTILASAWSGLMLSFEDGSGVISMLSRGAVQMLSGSIMMLTRAMDFVPPVINAILNGFKGTGIGLAIAGNAFLLLGQQIAKFAVEAQLLLADVPIVGSAIDEKAAKRRLKFLDNQIDATKDRIKAFANETVALNEDTIQGFKDAAGKHEKRVKELNAKEAKINEEFREGEADADTKANDNKLKDKEDFLKKLTKMEQDHEDKTELEKIQRKRERHLAELDELELNETEKREAQKRINDYYDGLASDQQKEDDDKAAKIKLEQKEKDDREREEQAEKEEAARVAKVQGMMDVLDSAARVAGEESKIGKALLAIKTVMQLKELAMKMKASAQELFVKKVQAAEEATIEGAKVGTAIAAGSAETSKVGFPWNVITMASYALQAVSLVKAFKSSKAKLDSTTGISSGGGSITAAAPQAPSFNVLGQTSAGDNMLADVIGQSNQTMRAYVVESDVASVQSLTRNATDLSSID